MQSRLRRPAILALAGLTALAAAIAFVLVPWRQHRPPEPPAPSAGGRKARGPRALEARPRLPELGRAAPDDPFPLDDRLRIYDTPSGGRAGDGGVLIFERFPSRRERLSDGLEYVVVDTNARTRLTGARRLVSREWFRRTPTELLCARRQEGPLTSDLEPPQPLLVFPLSVGRTWRWSGTAGGRRTEMTCRVAACERVTVGAGTFDDTWRIDCEVRAVADRPDVIRRSLWFQPGLGLIEERSTVEADGRTVQLDAALAEVLD